jgi:hypothetical protein
MSEAGLPADFLSEAVQLCTVTRDYRKAVAGFLKLGIGPWQVHSFGPETVSDMTYRGKPSPHVMKVCLARLGRMEWEIIQPVEGPTIYESFSPGMARGRITSPSAAPVLLGPTRSPASRPRAFACSSRDHGWGACPMPISIPRRPPARHSRSMTNRRASSCRSRRNGGPQMAMRKEDSCRQA